MVDVAVVVSSAIQFLLSRGNTDSHVGPADLLGMTEAGMFFYFPSPELPMASLPPSPKGARLGGMFFYYLPDIRNLLPD